MNRLVHTVMFWESVKNGLLMMTYWETYVALGVSSVLTLIPIIITREKRVEDNIVVSVIGGPIVLMSWSIWSNFLNCIFLTFAVIFVIWSLSPIILGIRDVALWGWLFATIIKQPYVFFAHTGFVFLVIFLFSYVTNLPLLLTIGSGVSLSILFPAFDPIFPNLNLEQVDTTPSLSYTFGFIIIAIVIYGIVRFVAVFLQVHIRNFMLLNAIAETDTTILDNSLKEEISVVITTSIFCFIPVFIYGAWLGTQI